MKFNKGEIMAEMLDNVLIEGFDREQFQDEDVCTIDR
ncbi:hypothetical protein J2Z81_001570 [Virgibacillus campisalis]|uniref:Transposase n=1 Tax=Virgibacillus alimentarius TaxID=698769 RepID=A0ABS4S7Z7_9BACI|nr:hypothetical protein [Virgibacillus alimentarius]